MHALQAKILDPRIGNEFPLPAYATVGSAGLDLRAMLKEDTVLEPGQTLLSIHGVDAKVGKALRRCAFTATNAASQAKNPGFLIRVSHLKPANCM